MTNRTWGSVGLLFVIDKYAPRPDASQQYLNASVNIASELHAACDIKHSGVSSLARAFDLKPGVIHIPGDINFADAGTSPFSDSVVPDSRNSD